MPRLTHEQLRERLHYDPETGVFKWLTRIPHSKIKPGDVAGVIEQPSPRALYRRIHIGGERFYAHALAWFYVTGQWAKPMVDHQDGDGLNNRFLNLRPATNQQNQHNQKYPSRASSTGYLGVSALRDGKFGAAIKVDGVKISLGKFDEPQIASTTYLAAKAVFHPAYVPAR